MTDYIFGPFTNWISSYYQDDYTIRIWIPPSMLSSYPGNFTITFAPYGSSSVYIDKVCVGQSAGATATQDIDPDSGIEQVYFDGGSASVTYSASKTSDPITYAIDITKGLIISVELGASHSYIPKGPNTGDSRTYYGSGAYGCVYDTALESSGYHWLIESIQWDSHFFFLDADLPAIESEYWQNQAHEEPAAAHAVGWAALPLLESDAASQCDNLAWADLPALTIEAQGGEVLGVDATLPDLEIDARVADWGNLDKWLPGLEIEAQAGERADLDVKLPNLEIEVRMGGRADDLDLPALEIDAVLNEGHIGSLDKLLPGIKCEALIGARLDSTLPDMELQGEITFDLLASLDKTLPGLKIEATGSDSGNGVLDADIPMLLVEGDIGCDPVIALEKILPGITCAAHALASGATLDKRLPTLGLVATGDISAVPCTLDKNLPAVIMSGEGYGTGGGTGGGYVADKGRFDDYILRYSR